MGDTCLLVFVPFFQEAGATSAHICTSEASMGDTCLLTVPQTTLHATPTFRD